MPHSMPSDEKRCSKCGVVKKHSEFARDRRKRFGLHCWCKACVSAKSRAWEVANRDRLRQVKREWSERNATKLAPIHRAASRAWQQRNPEKTKAHSAVQDALKAGNLTRPPTCSQCGKTGRIEAHHEDYAKPLDVQWLCRLCHAAITYREQRERFDVA